MATIPVREQTPPASKETPAQLDDILVTATKREKSVRDIPVTVNAFTGEDLVQRGATNLEEIVKLAPGVTKNANRVVMRGVGTSALGTFVTSEEVGRFFGDASLNAPSVRGALADLDPFDMQTVEVLKGPQGTLFGGTALAGAVRFVPRKPDLYGFAGALRAGIGTVEHSDELQKEVNVMLNGGFADSIGVRVVGTKRDRPGAVDDLHSGQKDVDFRNLKQSRVLATWQPMSDLGIDFTYLNWQEELGHNGFTDRSDQYETRIKRIPEPGIMKSRLFSLHAEYGWKKFSLIGIANRLKQSWYSILDLAPLLGTQNAPGETPDFVSTRASIPSYELRLVSSEPSNSDWWILRNWDYLAGVFFMKAEQHVNNLIVAQEPLPPPIPGAVGKGVDARAQTDVGERAFFFDMTRTLFDKRLELNFGGRLARTQLHSLTYTNENGQQVTPSSNSKDEQRFNPKVALTWHFSNAFSIYSSATQGFRFGGANANATADAEDIPRVFKSDSLWNYEAGIRTDWLDRTLRFDVTGFRINWKDLQITQVSQSAQNFVTNVGAARILGAESALLWRLPSNLPLLPEGFSISLSGSYIDARITQRFKSARDQVEPGTRLPLTPYVLANAALNWDGYLGSWLVNAQVSDAYSGKRKNDLTNTVPLPSYTSLGAALRVSNPGMRFTPEFSINGTNLLDEAVPHFAFPAVTGSQRVYILNRPRTVLLSAQVSF